MSWSVGRTTGRPGAVKTALAGQFNNAKRAMQGIPHELATIERAERLINDQLDFMIEQKYPAVIVEAGGSSNTNTFQGGGSSSLKLIVEPIYCFQEDAPQPEPANVEEPAAV
jgi:hypothetical protein